MSFLLLVSLIGVNEIHAQGQRVLRQPESVVGNNSQTMSLLEGHINPNLAGVIASQVATVDGSALVATTANPNDAFAGIDNDNSGQIYTYIVRDGDTLSAIAKMFGVSVNTIMWANDLRNGTISIGQTLVILPISGVKHTVVKGDTLQSIAKKYKADLGDILAYNGLASDTKLSEGDTIIVPDGESVSISTSSSGSGTSGLPIYAGYYMRPIIGGYRSQGIHGHNGVDLSQGGKAGGLVMAAANGKVIIARSGGWNGGYGSYVVIAHGNGTQTLYAHLSAVNVSVGMSVAQGQTIGLLGSTGKSTGPHLHFEVRGAKNPF